ncbi:DMT family transporter [Usitatibacter palustris]|nr:DMT family transporter [Usitatibacter palustris]
MDDHPLRRALPLILLSGLCFSTLDATAKYLVRDHTLLLVVWARYVGQMLIVTPISWHRAGPSFWRTNHLRMQLARSLCLVVATLSFFGALRYVPLAEGSAITFLAPMFAIALSGPILGEKPTRARWIAVVGGFVGILILVRPGSAVFHPATGFLVLAAIANAVYQLLTRRLPNDSQATTLFYSGLMGTLVLTVLLPVTGTTPTAFTVRDGIFLVMLGAFAGLGHWALTSAFLRAPASMIAPFTYMQMVWATLYGFLVFDQLPDALSALGMAVIVASGVLLLLHERRLTGTMSKDASR